MNEDIRRHDEQNYFEQIYNVVWDSEAGVRNHITILQNYRMFNRIPPIRIAHQALLTELLKFEERRKEEREKEFLREEEMSKNSPRSKNSGRKIRSSQMMKFLETKSTPSPRTKGCDKSEDKGGEDKGGEDNVRLEDKIDSQNDSEDMTFGRILLNWIGKDTYTPPLSKTKMESSGKESQGEKNKEKSDKDKKEGSWWGRDKKMKKIEEIEKMEITQTHPAVTECQEKMEVDLQTQNPPDTSNDNKERSPVEEAEKELVFGVPLDEEEEPVFDEQGLVVLSGRAIRKIFTYERNEYKDFYMSKQERTHRKRSGEQSEKDVSIDVLKIYKIYMTSMEEITGIIEECEASSFRFKALLKVEGSKRENDRLSLRDLMIEPVQRLPRIILLLDAILRKTETDHPDHQLLEHVQDEFKNVATLLNDRKREVDEKYKLLSALGTIQDFPKHTKHSSRKLVGRYNAVTLGDLVGTETTVKQGNHVCLWFIIRDDVSSVENVSFPERQAFFEEYDSLLEIVRLRMKAGSVNSAASMEKSIKKTDKPYQHIIHVNMRAVTHVYTVLETDDKVGITYVDPPPRYHPTDQVCGLSEEKGKSKEITLAFRLENEENCSSLEMDAKRMEWKHELVTHVNKSRQTFSLPPIDTDFQIDPNFLHNQLFKDKSKRDIFNFAKRSVSRAFSQNKQNRQGKTSNLRKAQSQIVLNSNDEGFVFGKSPPPGHSSVRFPKRTMRDSH